MKGKYSLEATCQGNANDDFIMCIYVERSGNEIQLNLHISNTVISTHPLISKHIVQTHFLFFVTFQLQIFQTTGISK